MSAVRRWFSSFDGCLACHPIPSAKVTPRLPRGLQTLALLSGVFLLALLAAGAGTASAFTTTETCALPGSTFQGGDGNQLTPNLEEQAFCSANLLPTTEDWQNLTGVTNLPDKNEPDSRFEGGTKMLEPGNWAIEFEAGGVKPEASNIISVWSRADPEPTATFLYLAMQRAAGSGNSDLSFELNQVQGTWKNGVKNKEGNEIGIPCRTTGDILFAYNVTASNTVEIVLYRWKTTESKNVEINGVVHPCATKGTFESLGPVKSPVAQGAMNFSGPISNFLTDTVNPTPSTFITGAFGEASLDLSDIFTGVDLSACFSFGQIWAASRSSTSIESNLQDFVSPVPIQADSCSISGRKFVDANGSGVDEPGKPGVEGWKIQLFDETGTKLLKETTTGPGGSYTFTGVEPGTYVVREVGRTGWTCTYPGTGAGCQHTVTIGASELNSLGNDFGNQPTTTVTTKQQPATGVVGTPFGDSATVTVSEGAPHPSGNVEFRLYSDAECKTLVAGPILAPLSEAGHAEVAAAARLTLTPGEYWWVATYPGNIGSAHGASGCAEEPVKVERTKPAIKTVASGPVTVGAKIKDTATLTGVFGTLAGGTVTFRAFSNDKCSALLFESTEPVPVGASGEVTVPSAEFTTEAAGSVFWTASYSGDTNNTPVESPCDAERESAAVERTRPAIRTSASNPVTVGEKIKDSATLTGVVNTLTGGTVTFKAFSTGKCEGTPLFESKEPVPAGAGGEVTVPSHEFTTTAAGTVLWTASYSGDANNEPVDSLCGAEGESSVVERTVPAIVTGEIRRVPTVGDKIKDTATVSGLFDTLEGGTVTFKVFANDRCDDLLFESTTPVPAGVTKATLASAEFTTKAPGAVYWIASYSGDSNNSPVASHCGDEITLVEKAVPEITTSATASAIVGSGIKDAAILNNVFETIEGGTVTFKAFANDECDGTPLFESTSPVPPGATGEVTVPSGEFAPKAVATVFWTASYTGDANNRAAASACGEAGESSVVEQAPPAIATVARTPVIVGGAIKDTATISGLVDPTGTGTVTFRLYRDSECTAEAFSFTSGTITANGSVESAEYTTAAAGTYYWVAVFSGDANNRGISSGCTAEPVVVEPATPALTTVAAPATGEAGSAFKDTATISGLFGAPPGGQMTWKLYSANNCTGEVAAEGPVGVTGDGAYSTPAGATITKAGIYYWVASYSGDADNRAVSSACAAEPVAVAAGGALAEIARRGTAASHSARGCIAESEPVYVTGREIKSVTFYFDGPRHKLKTVKHPDRKGRFLVTISAHQLSYHGRRIEIVVVFDAASKTKTKTMHVSVARCLPPRFTG